MTSPIEATAKELADIVAWIEKANADVECAIASNDMAKADTERSARDCYTRTREMLEDVICSLPATTATDAFILSLIETRFLSTCGGETFQTDDKINRSRRSTLAALSALAGVSAGDLGLASYVDGLYSAPVAGPQATKPATPLGSVRNLIEATRSWPRYRDGAGMDETNNAECAVVTSASHMRPRTWNDAAILGVLLAREINDSHEPRDDNDRDIRRMVLMLVDFIMARTGHTSDDLLLAETVKFPLGPIFKDIPRAVAR